MKILDFNELLKDSILIADGAMGSLLHEAVGSQRCFDELNTTEPEAVFRVHQAYIEAGAQIIEKVVPHLPDDLFPGGAKAGWWAAAVQLDLEAKGIIKRGAVSPVRLYRVEPEKDA